MKGRRVRAVGFQASGFTGVRNQGRVSMKYTGGNMESCQESG